MATTKNEIIARWLSLRVKGITVLYKDNLMLLTSLQLDDYNLLHEAWVKFRDLKGISNTPLFYEHSGRCTAIINLMVSGTITEAFDELCKGIEWYNNLNK